MTADFRAGCGLVILVVLLLLSTLFPWGEVRGTPQFTGGPPAEFFGQLFAGPYTFHITAWNGGVSLGALQLPNWLPIFFAVLILAGFWLRALAVLPIPKSLLILIATCGLLHILYNIITLTRAAEGSPSFALYCAFFLFAGMLVVLIRGSHPMELRQVEKPEP